MHRITRCSLPYSCIHEKIYLSSKVLEKLPNCICTKRLKLLLKEDIDFANFISTYISTHKINDAISVKKLSKMKHVDAVPIRDRNKRPDKQLYVPRALRKEVSENGKDCKNKYDSASDKFVKVEEHKLNGKIQELDQVKKYNPENLMTASKTLGKTENLLFKEQNRKEIKDKTLDFAVLDIPDFKPGNELSFNTEEIKTVENVIDTALKTLPICNSCIELSEQHDTSHFENDMAIDLENIVENESSSKLSSTMHKETCTELENVTSIIQEKGGAAKINNSSEDSWESKFNDEGDCLDPRFVKELCDITGRIQVSVAKSDYSDYQPVSRNSCKEYDNIVELYGFPVEFKTKDLTSAFSSFQEASYYIKWVDDCHALAIFSSPVIASQALHLHHPFIKVRSLAEGTKESKEKAQFCSRVFETSKPRPVTSAVLARRLVSGALGLKVNSSKEQRDSERKMLREAKEKKRLKAKQRQDIWNGIVS